MRDNVIRTENQQERLHLIREESSETTRRSPQSRAIVKAYLFGALHDGHRHAGNRTRIAQKDIRWLRKIKLIMEEIGEHSWIYKEGKNRNVYILESVSKIFQEEFDPSSLESGSEIKAYIRGFFDAEGGTPHSENAFHYIQLVQKDFDKIELIKSLLMQLGIETGKIHNPSVKADPNYWRIFVSRNSILKFVGTVGSWHPRKEEIFKKWMKI
jgi:intein-encoded DNA endonuclease-like protein